MNNLTIVLSSQGKYKQAEEMFRQVLKLSETVLSKDHPNTLTSMSNLATVLGVVCLVDTTGVNPKIF